MAQTQPTDVVRLDGRTLEGGGQLVRIAVALSALTGRSVTIDNVRGNRYGGTGLKASHLAAIQTLGELSGSTLVNAQVGSCSMGFYPPSLGQEETRRTDSEINIRLPTPGSVFLVLQALYPYLLHASTTDQIRLSIIGGTNASSSPSYDYVSQVLIPNFVRVGLPPISVRLEKRGWSSGQVQMGKVMFVIDTLRRRGESENGGTPSAAFPSIDLQRYRRGTISKIDITILAPDDPLGESDKEPQHTKGNRNPAAPNTVRELMEHQLHDTLRKQLKGLPPSLFSDDSTQELNPKANRNELVPIRTHTTEATHRRSCLSVLIVAHTSTGFRIGRDALYGSLTKPKSKPNKRQNKPQDDMISKVKGLVDECVEGFIRELHDPRLQTRTDQHRPCVDEYMRDQLVVFEALGRGSGGEVERDDKSEEDERYWSLHTKTAQWVCQQMLGGSPTTTP
ncbi:RNA 3'-terminal phosphate cyclase/enolpyruvate transferase [Aspergillus cavernicola]|uniref:RNA 3'-terminal phosphate cyclase/enolpyruvate transferase n=1 Tax=Aspergillus cavernicola TaxID=176166 RepID=A0ABR4IFC7_9EURO